MGPKDNRVGAVREEGLKPKKCYPVVSTFLPYSVIQLRNPREGSQHLWVAPNMGNIAFSNQQQLNSI